MTPPGNSLLRYRTTTSAPAAEFFLLARLRNKLKCGLRVKPTGKSSSTYASRSASRAEAKTLWYVFEQAYKMRALPPRKS